MRLIDKDKLIERINGTGYVEQIKSNLQFMVDMQPTIEERKKGKWKWCGNHHLCSECDEWALTRWDEEECDEVDILTDFCPNCGADMRKEEDRD